MADLTQSQQAFIDKYAAYANLASQQTGLPARVILGKLAIESNWGQNMFGNNIAGLKTGAAAQNAGSLGSGKTATFEDLAGGRTNITDSFLKYATPEQGIGGFVNWITNSGIPGINALADRPGGGIFSPNAQADQAAINALNNSPYSTDKNLGTTLPQRVAMIPDLAKYGVAPSYDPRLNALQQIYPYAGGGADVSQGAGDLVSNNYWSGTKYQKVGQVLPREKDQNGLELPSPAMNASPQALTALDEIANGVTGGLRAAANTIGTTFAQATGRLPTADEFKTRVDDLKTGASDLFSQLTGIAGSDEAKAFAQQTGLDPSQYVINDIYRLGLGRGADAGASDWAGNVLKTQGAQGLFDAITGSQEANQYALGNLYQGVLGRDADPAGLQGWLAKIQQGAGLPSVEAQILASPEAQSRGVQSDDWASLIGPNFAGTFGPNGITPTIGAPNATPTQGVGSFADLINNAYQTTLQRPADAVGTDYWTQALSSGSVAPDAIRQALTQSPEYAQTHPAQQVPTIGPDGTVTATTPNVQAIDPIDVGAYSPLVGPQTANTIGAPPAVTAFDPNAYRAANPDVAAAGVDPLTHWLRYGQAENRALDLAGDRFDGTAYLAANQDVALSGMNPLAHYLRYGMGEGRAAPIIGADGTVQNVQNFVNASTYAPTDWASIINTAINTPTQGAPSLTPTINNAVDAPIVTNIPQADHVWSPAETPTLSPTEFAKAWDGNSYLDANPDVRAAGLNPLQHYLQFGINENRAIDTKGDRLPVTFNSTAYLAANPDVAKAGLNPLAHFLTAGADEGRAASWDGNPYSFSSLNAGGYKIPGFTPATPAANYAPLDDLVAREGPAGGPVGSSGTAGFLADQINQLNQNVQQSANVERMLAPNGIPIPVFAQNQFGAGAAPQTAVNQNAYLNQVNTALSNMAPAAPSGASFLPKPTMSGPFW